MQGQISRLVLHHKEHKGHKIFYKDIVFLVLLANFAVYTLPLTRLQRTTDHGPRTTDIHGVDSAEKVSTHIKNDQD